MLINYFRILFVGDGGAAFSNDKRVLLYVGDTVRTSFVSLLDIDGVDGLSFNESSFES